VSQNGDEIRVAQGIYTGMMSVPGSFTATVVLTKSLSLLGGYTSNFSQRNPQAYTSTLDGQLQARSVVGVLGSQATIDGFSIINGRSTGGGGLWIGNWLGNTAVVTVSNNFIAYNHTVAGTVANTANGAGILVADGATATIIGNRIMSNTIEADDGYGAGLGVRPGATAVISNNTIAFNTTRPATLGGGMNVYSATVLIISNTVVGNSNVGIDIADSPAASVINNTVLSNTSVLAGAGIRIGGPSTVITITGNTVAYNFSAQKGGGIYQDWWSGVATTITNNQVLHNSAEIEGGGIWVGGAATIAQNVIAYNQAMSATVGRGAGLRAAGDRVVTIRYNDVYSNTAADGGGGGIDVNSPGIVEGNYIHHNAVTHWGGALFADGYQPITFTNNVVARNYGTGIASNGAHDIRIINNVSAYNVHVSDGATGGGITAMNWPLTSTTYRMTATLLNNVVVGNADCGINPFNLQVVKADYNDSYNNLYDYCGLASPPGGTHNLSVDPKFVSAAANDYHIRFGSPAMNTGTSVGAPAYDKDGVRRPQMGRVDMGAYEVVAPYSVYLPTVLK